MNTTKRKRLTKSALIMPALSMVSALVLAACNWTSGQNNNIDPEDFITKIDHNSAFELAPEKANDKVIVISDQGVHDDKSFNQSAWEATLSIKNQLKIKNDPYFLKPRSDDLSGYHSAYNIALSEGYKYWILPGFKHDGKIQDYWKTQEANLKEAGVVIIGIDFDPGQESSSKAKVAKGHSISLTFDVKEAAFLVGYAAAKYLAEKYADNSSSRIINSFGGGNFPGVTDFIFGLIAGVDAWNQTNEPDQKVNFSSSTIVLNSGFIEGSSEMNGAVSSAVNKNNKMIFPVAGPATGSVLAKIATNNADQLVIGVDVDQSYSYSQYDSYFFSSVLKKIGQATYDVLGDLYSNKNGTIGEFKLDEKSVSLFKGLNDNFVGFAQSSVGGRNSDEAKKAQKALDESKTVYETNKEIIKTHYFVAYGKIAQATNAVPAYFKTMIDAWSSLSTKKEWSALNNNTAKASS